MEAKPLLECVPNISEGRRENLIARLADLCEVPGVRVLDRSSDADHNRTVLTWLGEPEPLQRAAIELCDLATKNLDLSIQRGAHPRLGVVDVVPFVPVGTTPMSVAIDAASATAREIHSRCGVPTFLYGTAAIRVERRRLANHRLGGTSSLAERMASGRWPADFGERLHPTAGAVLVGSRPPLTAFNLALETRDRRIARAIASSIRQVTRGGLHGVQALGFFLASRERAQVSVNLLEPTKTRLIDVVERTQRAAQELGTQVSGCQLVGLVPQRAVAGSSASELLLDTLLPEQILETHLGAC